MDFGSALLGIVIALVVKVAVMGLCGRLLVRLYRSTRQPDSGELWLLLPREDLPDVRVLWWALVLFAASELTCGVELYILLQSNPVLTGVHAVVSTLGMGLFALGLTMLLDRKLFHFAKPACLMNRVCRGCTVEAPAGCRYARVVQLLAAVVGFAAIPPLFASTERMNADPRRYLLPFPSMNAWYDGTVLPWLAQRFPGYDASGAAFYVPSSMFVIDFRIVPLVAMALCGVAVLLVQRRRGALAVRVLAFAVGMLLFIFLELGVYGITGEPLLGSLLHELAEFWFLVATAEFLARTFGPSASASATAAG